MDESSCDADFINLPLTFHRRLLEFLTPMDLKTRFRYARTCQKIWKMSEAGTNSWADYYVIFTGEPTVAIWSNGFHTNLTIANRLTQSLLLAGITVDRTDLRAFPAEGLSIGMRSDRLNILFSFEEAALVAILEGMKPLDRKYEWIRFEKLIPTTRTLHFINENVEEVHFPMFPERSLWSELKCDTFTLCTREEDDDRIQPYIDLLVEEWKKGQREILSIEIYSDYDDYRDEEHQREIDGQRIRVDYTQQGQDDAIGLYRSD